MVVVALVLACFWHHPRPHKRGMERTLALALCQHCAVIMGWMKVREKGSIIIGEGRGEGQKRETIGTGHHHC